MSPGPSPIAHETLLAHREWVRSLARSLVVDPNAAADVEQQTWLTALETPPAHQRSLRGWLGTVARNAAHRMRRTETRRAAREHAVARTVHAPAAADLAARADAHRRVVQAVVELSEPYRETLLLRFFEGLPLAEIAARTAVPVETAKARLRRGRLQLRERLGGDASAKRGDWRLALVPLLARDVGPVSGASAAVGGVMVGKLMLGGIAAVLVCVGALWVVASQDAGPSAAEPTPVEDASGIADTLPIEERPRAAEEKDVGPPTESPPRPERVRVTPPVRSVPQRLEKALESVAFDGVSLEDCCVHLTAHCGVPILLAAELLEGRAKDELEVNLRLGSPASVKTVLDLLTRFRSASWVVDGDRVVIVPASGEWDRARVVVPGKASGDDEPR